MKLQFVAKSTTTSSVRKRKNKREKIVWEREKEAIKVKIPIVSLLESSVRLDPRSTLLLSYKEWLFFSRQEQVFWFLHTLLTDRTFSFCDIKSDRFEMFAKLHWKIKLSCVVVVVCRKKFQVIFFLLLNRKQEGNLV